MHPDTRGSAQVPRVHPAPGRGTSSCNLENIRSTEHGTEYVDTYGAARARRKRVLQDKGAELINHTCSGPARTCSIQKSSRTPWVGASCRLLPGWWGQRKAPGWIHPSHLSPPPRRLPFPPNPSPPKCPSSAHTGASVGRTTPRTAKAVVYWEGGSHQLASSCTGRSASRQSADSTTADRCASCPSSRVSPRPRPLLLASLTARLHTWTHMHSRALSVVC